MAAKQTGLDQKFAFLGFLLGLLLGGLYAIAHIGKNGELRRRDLASLGGATLDLEIEASMKEAKAAAQQRLNDAD